LLDENKVVYQDFDLAKDKVAMEEMVNLTGQTGVPVIDIDGEIAVGYDWDWLKTKLGI
jgi:glutaredoxin 3